MYMEHYKGPLLNYNGIFAQMEKKLARLEENTQHELTKLHNCIIVRADQLSNYLIDLAFGGKYLSQGSCFETRSGPVQQSKMLEKLMFIDEEPI